MSLNLFQSHLKHITLLLLLLLSAPFIKGQDTITAFGQTGTARLDVNTTYSFTLTSATAGAAAAVWTVTGASPFVAGDFTITGAPGPNVSIIFSPNLISPSNAGKSANDTYIVTATYGAPAVATSITVTLLPEGGLLKENLVVKFKRQNPLTGLFTDITSLDLQKGETAAEGELVKVEFSLLPKTPALPLTLSIIKKIGLKVVNLDGTPLYPSPTLPPLIQMTASLATTGNLSNTTIPAINLAINEKGRKEFVFYPYAEIPYVFRMDRIDFNNNVTEPRDNYSNFGRELLDPRINYDYFRSKMFFDISLSEYHIFNGASTVTATGALLTDDGALFDIDTNLTDTVYNFKPNPTPSANAVAGYVDPSPVYANRFTSTFSGSLSSFDLPLKALEFGGVGSVRFLVEIYNSQSSTTPIISEPLITNITTRIPSMTLNFQLDGETIANGNSITTVAGKDINLRIFVDRVVNAGSPIGGVLEGNSGAQEYLLVDDQVADTDILWAFRNFDEMVFDAMEFDPMLYQPTAAQTQSTPSVLFNGYVAAFSWKHHGLHLNLQSFQGTLSNCLFNDIPYLIAHDNDIYAPANAANGRIMNNNSRYTLTRTTKIGLVRDDVDTQRFMYSQARLYTRDAATLREGLPSGTVRFAANLFANARTPITQRAVTFVPRVVGTYAIKVDLKTADGTQSIDTQTVTINVIPEIINVVTLDPAEADDVASKPLRAGDLMTYADKSSTSTYADHGITSFNMRLEGIGAADNILQDENTGNFGAQSYGEVDLDDILYFAFTVKSDYSFYYISPNNRGAVGKLGRADLDNDFVGQENFYEVTGRPEPVHLQANGIDDDNDGVVDDTVSMPTGRAESAAIRISTGSRSIYYLGGTLRNYYDFDAMKAQVALFEAAVSALNAVPLTVAILNATQAAYPTITSAAITAAFNTAKADPFLTNVKPSSPRKLALLNNILNAIAAYEYYTVNYPSMINELTLANPLDPTRPTDDFAPVPTAAGMAALTLNTYLGEVVDDNYHTVGSALDRHPIKRASAIRTCIPLKEVWYQFAHQIPWVNRTGGTGLVPLSFAVKGTALPTGFAFIASNAVTDKKFVGPFASLSRYPFFTNPIMTALGKPDTYQNFSTTFKFTGGVNMGAGDFVNRMTNNYRPFLNIFEPALIPPDPNPIEYANLAGLNGWVFTYSADTLNLITDGVAAEGKTWIIEERVGPIVDLPDAIYTITDPQNFNVVRQNQIIIPEEDSRWRPDDDGLQGFESWYRNFPIREVIATESQYVAQFGVDLATDPEHYTGAVPGVVDPSLYFFHLSCPSPAFHEVAGNNVALRLFLPSEMLDLTLAYAIFEDIDNNGTFNIGADTLLTSRPSSALVFNSLTRTYQLPVPQAVALTPDIYYDEKFDFFLVTVLDSGYPDKLTGPPPFNVANQPDSSAVRFGSKTEIFEPGFFPKSRPEYANFIDRDGKQESIQDNYLVVNARADNNDVNMKCYIYADSDHPLESAGYVVHQGGTAVKAMTGRDQIGGVVGNSVTKDSRSPADLTSGTFSDATQKFGSSSFPFVPFSRAALSTLILTGDAINPGFFPISAQGTSTLPNGIMWNHIHLPILPRREMTAGFDKTVERKNAWRNDVYAQVRPFERDKNGNGVCDPDEDFNSDGYFTQDVVLLNFTPEVYPTGHPKAGQSFYNATNDFLNMADIRWSIVKNESGSYLSSDTGYLIAGDSTGTNYVTYYPGSLNGVDYVKAENIKTGRSMIAAILVRNNPATDGIDNDNDAPLGTFVTTIGTLVGLPTSDPRYGIRCFNPSASVNAVVATALENFPNIDFADDDYLDGAGSLDAGYSITPFTDIGTGATNKGNVYINVTGTYDGESDISLVLTSTYAGTGTVGTNAITFSAAYTDSITLITTTTSLTLLGTSNLLDVYADAATSSAVRVTFLPIGGSIAFGDKFHFTMLGMKDWDGDGWRRGRELGNVPGAMFPETGYDTGLEIDLSWNNPRPFYAIKVRADKAQNSAYDGEYAYNYEFTTNLKTKEVIGSGVWTSTVEMQIDDRRYIGSPNPPRPLYTYFFAGSVVNNTLAGVTTDKNILTVTGTPTILGGTDLIRITQNPDAIIRGEWIDNTGDVHNYPLAEYCLFPHMTVDMAGRVIYDFDLATLPGDNTRYAASVFESNHTIADYTSPDRGLLRIDPNCMPTPVLQLNAADTSDYVTLTFTDGERLQKIRVNFLNVTGFKPTAITDDPNAKPQDTMLAPLSNDMLGGISLWKDNKDPGKLAVAVVNATDLITSGRSALIGSLGHFDALVDIIVDLDGWDSSRAYTNFDSQFSNPLNEQVLSSFALSDKIYFVDRDGSKSFSLGDDIYLDQGQPGLDNGDKIIYTQKGLGTGASYSLGDPAHSERLRYYDANANGKYDNGEDMVYEASNLNGLWELPIDKYIPLDKDALRWRWDKENNLWYIVMDLENDEEVPPEDIFTRLLDYVDPATTIAEVNPGSPITIPQVGGVEPNFYSGADYHVCIRTSTNMDYLTAFMVEIPDYWKHTQALTNFDDIAGVWLASQPSTVTYPSMPGSSIISPIIVANMPVEISDEAVDRATRNRIGRNSKPFPILGINLMDNTFNSLKVGNDLLKKVFGSNTDTVVGSTYGVRLTNISGNRKTVLEDLVVEMFNRFEGTVGGSQGSTGTIDPGDFNPVSDLLALDRSCKGDDIFRSADGKGIFSAADTKILRLGSYLENGRLNQDDLTVGKQGKQDPNIVFVDIDSDGVYDDNKDILVYDIDGLTSNGLPTGVRTFKFGDAILKRGFSNWDDTVGATNDVTKLTPNDLSLIIGKQLVYDSSLWYEDDDDSGGFSNEVSGSGVALYRDRSDGSPYDNGKFDSTISSKNEVIVLDEVIYLEEIEYAGAVGQPQHQVRMRPAVFDISSTFLTQVTTNGLVDLTATSVDHFVTDYGRNASASQGGTGTDYRDPAYDALFNPFIDVDGNGIDDSNKLYPYNTDTSLPDHHPLRVNLFQDKLSPSYGDENGMGPYGEWGYLRAPMDDGQNSLSFDPTRAIIRNTGNKHLGPDFFVVIRTSNVATNGDDFRAGIASWGRDPAHLMFSAPQKELGNRGIGFDDRVEDTEIIGLGGGVNPAPAFLYPGPPPSGYTGSTFGDTSNSRTYTKFLSAVVLVDGQPPEDVKTLTASVFEGGPGGTVPLVDQIRLDWEWENDPDTDRAGVIIIRRKGLAPDLKQLEDGEYYIGPELTSEVGEERRKYLAGYLGFATKTKLTSAVSAGSVLASAMTTTTVSIDHADFASLPTPPSGGKCYLLIGASVSGEKAEIVSYTTVGTTIIVKRGELGTTAVSHSAGASVTFLPPRPVAISQLLKDTAPTSSTTVVVKVDKTVGLAGFPATGVIRIGAEVMTYDGVTFGATEDSLNLTVRGVNSTVVAPHSAGNKINWSYHPTYTADTISVTSTAGFPVSGRLKIDNEEMWYNAKTATTFKGIVRGIFTDDANKTDTPVVSHLSGSDVIDSLYKVIMNDKDLDGPSDYNNDGNEDDIVVTWTDDLFYGDEPSTYFYYLFTYDDVLNYSEGKFASVNSMLLKRYTAPSGSGTGVTSAVSFGNINLGSKINVKGGETIFLTVEGGSPKFAWTASAAGLSLETAPAGYDTKGETDRYVSYTVPDIPDVDQTDIIITVTDSSANQQSLSVVLFVTEVTDVVDPDAFRVTSTGAGTPTLNTNKDATITVLPGDVVTFQAFVPAAGNINTIVWSAGTPITFNGAIALTAPDTMVYSAVSGINPALTSGIDTLVVTDGTSTITITIIISPDEPDKVCDSTKPLSVVPGNSGTVLISPGASFTLTAQGGTCSFTWSLIANNSEGASLVRKNNVSATYTAGTINRSVDVIELSDGITTKRIEVHVTSSSSNGQGGGGCFIRNKASERD